MEKAEHGERLRTAMARKSMSNEELAFAVGVKVRSVTNWRSGANFPKPAEREMLRELFPGYDYEGDAVEAALKLTELTDDRQSEVLTVYKRVLRQQREAGESATA